MNAIIILAIFILVYLFSLEAMREACVGGPALWHAVAFITACLSLLALHLFSGGGGHAGTPCPAENDGHSLLMGILLPYATLAVALLGLPVLILFILFIEWVGSRRGREDNPAERGIRGKAEGAGSTETTTARDTSRSSAEDVSRHRRTWTCDEAGGMNRPSTFPKGKAR